MLSVLRTLSNVCVSLNFTDILAWPLPHSNPARSPGSVCANIFQPCIDWETRELLGEWGQVRVPAGILTHLDMRSGSRVYASGVFGGFRPARNDTGDFLTETSKLPPRE